MQVFLVGYFLISLCEIFSIGEFPLNESVRIVSRARGPPRPSTLTRGAQVFSALHIGFITATLWALMVNAMVGYQLIDDGTVLSMGALILSSAILFIGTAYIALDTGFEWTGYWNDSYPPPNRQIALYVLYQLLPLVFLVAFFALETILVLRVLGETRPMLYLLGAAVLFALGQIFTYVVSTPICEGTAGKIDGSMFQTLFNLLAVVTVWIFWSSITEDDWPMPVAHGQGVNYP